MFKGLLLCIPRSDAIGHAAKYLTDVGIPVTYKPAPDVTHLLLPVPSFPTGDEYLAHYLADLPDDVVVSGGNLRSPLLEHSRCVDFLTDPYYLAQNAAITADCALVLLEQQLPQLSGKSVLVLGWGRIGKCLSPLLRSKGCDVAIAARKHTDLAMIQALGYSAVHTTCAAEGIHRYDAILNTVPELILPNINPKPDCIVMELASKPGITGCAILNARGLPGKMAPRRSGKLIAETFIRLSI